MICKAKGAQEETYELETGVGDHQNTHDGGLNRLPKGLRRAWSAPRGPQRKAGLRVRTHNLKGG